MTSINSVSSTTITTKATEQESELSAATKAQLEAIGIDPSTVSSESQAQALIANANGASFKSMLGGQNKTNSSDDTYLREAKSLASSIGVTYSSSDSIEDILSNISSKLNQMMSAAQMNPSQVQMIQMYRSQLDQISSNYSQAQSASLYSVN